MGCASLPHVAGWACGGTCSLGPGTQPHPPAAVQWVINVVAAAPDAPPATGWTNASPGIWTAQRQATPRLQPEQQVHACMRACVLELPSATACCPTAHALHKMCASRNPCLPPFLQWCGMYVQPMWESVRGRLRHKPRVWLLTARSLGTATERRTTVRPFKRRFPRQ